MEAIENGFATRHTDHADNAFLTSLARGEEIPFQYVGDIWQFFHFIENIIDSIPSFLDVVKTAIFLTNRTDLSFLSYSTNSAKSHNCCDGELWPGYGKKLALKLDFSES
jgi:hypothetical protein